MTGAKNNIFLKPNDKTYGERVDDNFGLYRGAKAIRRKTQSRWWKQRYNLGAISQEQMQIEALKEAYELKEMYGENIISLLL